MAIARYDPFRDFLGLQQEIGRWFERSFGMEKPEKVSTSWTPVIDMFEKDNQLVIKTELPGIDAKDVEITVDEELLTIRGERRFEEKAEEKDYYRLERRYGSFERAVTLPAKIKKDEVKATYKEGVLTIILPEAVEIKPKPVKVEVEGI